jgi:DNA-binding response OmpR family regulator
MRGRTILVAHTDPAYWETIVPRLVERGYHVVGPATTARVALALATQTPVSLALVGEKLAGVRDGRAVARALRRLWGVPSILVRETAPAPC